MLLAKSASIARFRRTQSKRDQYTTQVESKSEGGGSADGVGRVPETNCRLLSRNCFSH